MHLFETVLGAVQVGGALVLSPFLRSWYNHWGAELEQTRQPLPGDELVPSPQMGYTRAITIHAPPERIWPWLVQMGQGRGGLYSYDSLENLAGCDIHSADRILPDFQNLQIGDLIRLGPQGYPCFSVASINPGRALVLISADPKTGQPVGQPVGDTEARSKGYSIATWQFILEPQKDGVTRLFIRQRLAYSPDLTWVWRITEPIGFVMERKMMLGIQHRAEHPI